MEIFYREKAFHAGKKIRKNNIAPSEKFSCYTPAYVMLTLASTLHEMLGVQLYKK